MFWISDLSFEFKILVTKKLFLKSFILFKSIDGNKVTKVDADVTLKLVNDIWLAIEAHWSNGVLAGKLSARLCAIDGVKLILLVDNAFTILRLSVELKLVNWAGVNIEINAIS